MEEKKKILVVDDEKEIADLLEIYLKADGWEVVRCDNGKDAVQAVEAEPFSLALLDVMLPDMDGFSICRKIREKYFYPVIMLTARTGDLDKITGLTIGADDYITKPFNPLEVMARVKTQMRRYETYNHLEHREDAPRDEIDIRGLSISADTHKCTLNGKEIALTPIEFSILLYLCENRGRVVPSEEIFEKVWKEKFLDSNNTVMAHIGKIREKMKDSGRRPKYIKTVWGVGYQIE